MSYECHASLNASGLSFSKDVMQEAALDSGFALRNLLNNVPMQANKTNTMEC